MNEHLFARQAGLLDHSALSRLVYTQALRGLRPVPRLRFTGPGGCAHSEAGVNALAIERFDGRVMISGGADGTIRIWNLEEVGDEARQTQTTEQTIASTDPADEEVHPGALPLAEIPRAVRTSTTTTTTTTSGHRFGVTHLSFYPFDAAAFLSSSFDHSLRLWDTDAARLAGVFDLGAKLYRHAVSPVADHLLVACATQHPAVRLVDLRSGAAVQSLVAPGQEAAAAVLAVAWCPSPQRPHVLASGGADGVLRVWDVRRASALLGVLDKDGVPGGHAQGKAHDGPANALAWSDDGAFLVSAGHDRRLRVWDAATGTNTLVGFGPSVRNGALASAPLVLTPTGVGCGEGPAGSPDLLVWPNETEMLVFGLHDGRTVQRLRWGGGAGGGGRTGTSGRNTSTRGGTPRVTSLAWRGAGGLGSETGGTVLGGCDGPAGGVLYSGHLDGQVRAWVPGTLLGDEDEGFVDAEEKDKEATEERARKRRALDQAYRSLMGTQITFR